MDANELLNPLNPDQQRAVITDKQYTLVLAGAGSGKTRVLVHRIAWLCIVNHVPATAILAVTFTNKAATEMQEKIKLLLDKSMYQGIWVVTFHGLAYRLLRIFSRQAGLADNFQIIDSNDQRQLINRLMKEHYPDKNKKDWSCSSIVDFINNQKEQGIRACTSEPTDFMNTVYVLYEQICKQADYVDFSELLLRSYELLQQQDEDVFIYCKQRFGHILIDEFQDTNLIQFKLIKLLAGKDCTIMIVGDDDQSIYSWRGANADNLHHFVDEYAGTEVIRLEQNYRSSGAILHVANHLIANNQQRLGKNLWTTQHSGESINLYMGFNDVDEARYVVNQIKKDQINGHCYADCAILYRNNILSRVLEDTLLQAAVPYQIYGSSRFYERQEIKYALAYLRLLHNPRNNMAFEDVVNIPPRGIGEVTLNIIRQTAQQQQTSLWDTAKTLIISNGVNAKPKMGLMRFVELIDTMIRELDGVPLPEQLSRIIYDSGLYDMYQQEQGIKTTSRLENLEQLQANAEKFYITTGDDVIDVVSGKTVTALDAFLTYTALEGKENYQKDNDAVQLMTLHAAKGLEFNHVYIIGLDEGLFPSDRAKENDVAIEEERRLFYVGITRAKKKLTLTCSKKRRLYGREWGYSMSRFLTELPVEWVNHVGYQNAYVLKAVSYNQHGSRRQAGIMKHEKKQPDVSFQLGQRVHHPRFGEGTIIAMEGEDDYQRAQVAFVDKGIKWLVLKLANLQLIQ